MKKIMLCSALFLAKIAVAQDTFSIVAVDSITGEVGSAGASCISADNLELFFPGIAPDFLGDLLPGIGAINTQASYDTENQQNARARLEAGDSPAEAIAWLKANDAGFNPNIRQFGIVKLENGHPSAAAHTGSGCQNYKSHRVGADYSIQGNILLGAAILDSMEANFKKTTGCLSEKLMAALQGANVPGADTRCLSNGTSSMFAFIKVAKPGDDAANPSLRLHVSFNPVGIEPIDSLQKMFDAVPHCTVSGVESAVDFVVSIEPNPTAGEAVLRFSSGEKLDVEIFDSVGRLVEKRAGVISGERLVFSKKGVFWVKITSKSGKTATRRVVVE